jgi:hypothetical protein
MKTWQELFTLLSKEEQEKFKINFQTRYEKDIQRYFENNFNNFFEFILFWKR